MEHRAQLFPTGYLLRIAGLFPTWAIVRARARVRASLCAVARPRSTRMRLLVETPISSSFRVFFFVFPFAPLHRH